MAIAFFDLDLTLLRANSGALWIRKELREGAITRWQAARASLWIVRYHLGFGRMEDALLVAIASLAGKDEALMRQRTWEFWDEEVQGLLRPRGAEAIAAHRAAGDRVVLLTSSSNFLSEKASEALGLDDVLCNRFEVDADGRFTGRPLGPLCYGDGKLTHARAYAEARGVDLRDCAFYTDSAADLPVLQAVGRPVGINPDPRLRREIRRRGWEIQDWGPVSR